MRIGLDWTLSKSSSAAKWRFEFISNGLLGSRHFVFLYWEQREGEGGVRLLGRVFLTLLVAWFT